MYQYTTPTISCKIEGADLQTADYARISIEGKNGTLLRIVPVSEFVEDTATLTLSQEDTVTIGKGSVYIQARIHYPDGTVQATNKVLRAVNDVIDEVII